MLQRTNTPGIATTARRAVTLLALNALLTTWAGCFGCPCGSGPSGLSMTADPLDIDLLDGATTVMLEIVVDDPGNDWQYEGELELLPGGPAGWLVPAGIEAVSVGGCPFAGEATFTLVVDGEEMGDELPPMTVDVNPDYGGADLLELWDGWLVDVDWGGWTA